MPKYAKNVAHAAYDMEVNQGGCSVFLFKTRIQLQRMRA